MTEEESLLRELIGCMRVVHLDMSGSHRYIISQNGHEIINKIKGYLYEKDREDGVFG